ncbi:MAG TPA: orotate phosphoribosyltransferase [Firmicutes bacterium]|nr:orotate phosphoribosyltransferase [Bacillota bacterium]
MSEVVSKLFTTAGALLSGHFVLTSGMHSDQYMEKFAVLQYPDKTQQLCDLIAEHFKEDKVEVVLGPATGGILLAHGVAKALGTRSIFTEREQGKMTLRRGFAIKPGERVLVVEDVVTTGGSVFEVLEVVKAWGGELVGVGYLVDRSGGKADFGVKQVPLLKLAVQAWPAAECPLCQKGVAFTSRGSRNI